MTRTIILYAAALAAGAFLLEWLEYRYLTRVFSTEVYIVFLAVIFAALGAWIGRRLTRRPAPEAFRKNEAAIASLGITAREYETLEHLAAGRSNKEIARALGVSPNTVKTHLARLYEKLGAARRTQAVQKARMLALIP